MTKGFTLWFTGISDPYEAADDPEILLKTGEESADVSFQRVLTYLETHGHIPKKEDCLYCDYTVDDEMALRGHLAGLGFAGKVADI